MTQETAHTTTLTSTSHLADTLRSPTNREEEKGTRRARQATRMVEPKTTRTEEREQDPIQPAPEVRRTDHLKKFAGTISKARARKETNASTSTQIRAEIGRKVTANGETNAVTRIA